MWEIIDSKRAEFTNKSDQPLIEVLQRKFYKEQPY